MKNTDQRRGISMKKQSIRGKEWLFKTIAVLMPFLILLIFEVSLRLFDYGSNLNLFTDYPGTTNYLVFNPDASRKYFVNQTLAPTGNNEPFLKKKTANTLRIFVLGESTTIGYPYFHNGSFHRWLQYRLMRTWPDKNFEIINLSLTAVNSYTIKGFAKELVDYEPDAVLIYLGQNEYYGALGVGSTQNIRGNSFFVNLMLDLRRLRLTQLLTNLYQRSASALKDPVSGTRMELMVAEQHIPYQSELYIRGVEQFRSNMDQTLDFLNKHGIPVFISNLVSNEKDLKPFVSFAVDSLKYPAFNVNYKLGVNAYEKKDFSAASVYFEKANKLYANHAACNYYLGQLACRNHDSIQAKKYFIRAKDLDGLRFRAPEQFNEIIAQLCRKYPKTHLVDTKTRFEEKSANNIIGHELILEHVHPNLAGYAILSDAFYEAMKKACFLPDFSDNPLTFQQLLMDMPVSKIDSLAGSFRIQNLKGRWPFNEEKAEPMKVATEEEMLAMKLTMKQIGWEEAQDRLFNYYTNRHHLQEAKSIVETLALEHPQDAALNEKAAMFNGELQNMEKAIFYFQRSFEILPSFDKSKYLFVLCLKMDKPHEALPYLDYAIKNNTQGLNLIFIKETVKRIIKWQNAYTQNSSDLATLDQIASLYLQMGNQDAAQKYIQLKNKRIRERH